MDEWDLYWVFYIGEMHNIIQWVEDYVVLYNWYVWLHVSLFDWLVYHEKQFYVC
jgi:hypothetical protein